MKMIVGFVILSLFSFCSCTYNWTKVQAIVKQAIADRVFPGAVIAVGNATAVLYQKPFGTLTYGPELYSIPTKNDTKYDAASITKVMGTTLALMNLVAAHQISLDDKVSKYIEYYDTKKKDNTTLKNLLLHNAGLPYDYPGALPSDQSDVIDYIRYISPIYPVGSKCQYSNLGFLLLGKIIQKVTNKTLDNYTYQNRVFAGLKDTNFNPNETEFPRIAPTEYDIENRKRIIRGEAHERLAYFFNGVAGHSGLFTTAADLLRFMRILLNEGKIPGEATTLSSTVVKEFTTQVTGLSYNNTRSYGFDNNCPSSKMSNCFGHDGSTGFTAFADRDKNVTFVIVSNRGHPDVSNNKYFQSFRGKISDAIMEALGR